MIKTLLTVVLLCGSAFGAWTHPANDKCHSPGGVTSDPIAFTSSTAANSTIIVVYNGGGSTDTTTIGSALSLTYTQRVLFSANWAIWEAPNVSGGSETVTLNNGSGLFGQACIFEFDGGSSGFDAAGVNNTATSTSPSVASFSTISGDLLVASINSPGGANLTGLGGFTDTGTTVNGVNHVIWSTSSGSSSSWAGTLSFSDTWTANMVAMKTGAAPTRRRNAIVID